MKKIILFIIILCVISCNTTNQPKEVNFDLNIKNNKLINQSTTLRVNHNDYIKLNINSDQKTQIHIHGYDIEKKISPENTELIGFKANATGRFNITIHTDKTEHNSHSKDHKNGHSHHDDSDEIQLVILEVIPN
ncbi:MAG: hypothetical protein ACJ0A6_01375 [Dehalococcoidia bacterium]